MATDVGATLLAFDEGDWVEVRPAAAEFATSVYVAKAVHEAERLISVPVIKTHRNASFSCALKNTVGCVHGKNKPWAYGGAAWEPVVAELNLAVRPHLYVVDGLQSMVAGGPWSGESVRTNVILASGDPVAMDVVVLGLVDDRGVLHHLLERLDATLEEGLVVLGLLELGILREVAEFHRGVDALGHLGALGRAQLFELRLQLLEPIGRDIDRLLEIVH